MGDHGIELAPTEATLREFSRAILRDIRALELMLQKGMFERGARRMGVEQEMFLVDTNARPKPVAPELLVSLDRGRFTSELARYNLELNLPPHQLGGSFLSELEAELSSALAEVDVAAAPLGARVLLVGILPTLRTSDLSLDNMSPEPRYARLNQALCQSRGAPFRASIQGVDQLELSHDNVMLESANTSLQLHIQVDPDDLVPMYNLAQLISAPLVAVAGNSALLLGRRLWQETRVALFEHSVDSRSPGELHRGTRARVSFGDDWLRGSVLDLYRDDATRFRVLLTRPVEEDPLKAVESGRLVPLSALALHNGTVWRWNRACFGIGTDTAHLRIENRVLPAGPTLVDEVANAALFYGLMQSLPAEYGDVTRLSFEDAKQNFVAAARDGLDANFRWLNDRKTSARELLARELLPAARRGLQELAVPQADLDRYLGVLEQRIASGRTGARWTLDALEAPSGGRSLDARTRSVALTMLEHQSRNEPVSGWQLPAPAADSEHAPLAVADLMSTDLFTVRPDDVVDLAASVMDWRHVRHVPVENAQGSPVGLVSHRSLLRLQAAAGAESVGDVMEPCPPLVEPECSLEDAVIALVAGNHSCLFVVSGGRLAGIVTERDLLAALAARMQIGSKS